MIPHSQCQTTHSNPSARCFCPLWPTKFLSPITHYSCAQPTTLRERPTYRVTNLTGRGVTARARWLPKASFGKWKKCEKEKGSDFYPKSEIPGKYWHAPPLCLRDCAQELRAQIAGSVCKRQYFPSVELRASRSVANYSQLYCELLAAVE